MAGMSPEMVYGGAGVGTLTSAPDAGSFAGRFGLVAQPHHGVVLLVLLAVAVLFALDKAGFRFAVTAGKR